ncbi:hypothetical protein BH23CHL2_BH23CHL2_18550 [soil metagenome]
MQAVTSSVARMTDRSRSDVAATLDAGERTCAALIASIRDAIAPLQPGTILAILSRDPSARLDLPAWCRMTGHGYLGSDDHETHAIHYLRKRGSHHGEDSSVRQPRK